MLTLATLIGRKLARMNCICRSGAADGMDLAFEAGFKDELKEIYQPWYNFNNIKTNGKTHIVVTDKEILSKARLIASKIHPHWDRLKPGPTKMHTRNVFQVLGSNLNLKSDILICWAPIEGQSITGGTRTAYELAKRLKVPVYNLANEETRELFISWLKT
ncbi:DprA-like DNA recombination-mediator protein [Cronobacter phage S13]|jgi:hypothetical protein|uniref:DprA-like DNA recombination-mediator protein n=1 Tax=Cronobacter phage S13 TaxID=1327935 RepID=UPI000499EABE|nr:DprA-like DNA recombination-mediator protein [Cronobacter phage S13]AIA64877.1 hypothetical protein S13_078 [Cronobacter phage S13]